MLVCASLSIETLEYFLKATSAKCSTNGDLKPHLNQMASKNNSGTSSVFKSLIFVFSFKIDEETSMTQQQKTSVEILDS